MPKRQSFRTRSFHTALALLVAAPACTGPAKDEPEGTTTATRQVELASRRASATLEAPPNTAPTTSDIASRNVDEDGTTGPISFTISDLETAAGDLALSATSSNAELVPNSSVVFGGSGNSRTVNVFPAINGFGSTTITVTVSDGSASASDSFDLFVLAINDVPTITQVPDQNALEDVGVSGIPLTVTDVELPAGSLVLSATSSNQALVANENISFSVVTGDDTKRVAFLLRTLNAFGSSVITITVSDGFATAMTTFNLNVAPVNDPPTISNVQNLTIDEDTAVTVPFSVNDIDTPLASLAISGSSSYPVLVPITNLVFGGSGTSRTVTIAPALNQSGTSTMRLTVSDGALSASDDFVVTVRPVNDPPFITDIADQHINPGGTTGALSFSIGDLESTLPSLEVTGTSSNQVLAPNANIVFGGSFASRTVTVTPVSGLTGSATITVRVSDGALSTSDSFVISVGPIAASVPATSPKWLALQTAAFAVALLFLRRRQARTARAT